VNVQCAGVVLAAGFRDTAGAAVRRGATERAGRGVGGMGVTFSQHRGFYR